MHPFKKPVLNPKIGGGEKDIDDRGWRAIETEDMD
jgi:hypothetical protein